MQALFRSLCWCLVVSAFVPFASALAQTDTTWDDKIKEYLRNDYLLTVVAKTPDVVLAYLCRPNGNAWWAFKLTNYREGGIRLRGHAKYNTYGMPGTGRGHGQGVIFYHDTGPMFERERIKDERVPVSGFAEITIVARNDNREPLVTFSLGRMTASTAPVTSSCWRNSRNAASKRTCTSSTSVRLNASRSLVSLM